MGLRCVWCGARGGGSDYIVPAKICTGNITNITGFVKIFAISHQYL